MSAILLPSNDTPIHRAAEMYAELGFRVLPLHGLVDGRCTCGLATCEPRSAGKHPIHAAWQKHAASDLDVVRELFRGHRGNIGLMLADELVVLDVDGDEGFASLATLGDLPATMTSRSGSGIGEHRVYRYAEHHDPKQVTNRRIADGLDVKTRAGQIVVAPSLHRSGQRYEWINVMLPALLPDYVYEQIRPRRRAPAAASIPASGDQLYKRARAYVSKLPPAVSGSGGHDTTFAAARAIVGWVRKGLSSSNGWSLLCDYNNTCQPPWTERELEHKWQSALNADEVPELADRPLPDRSPLQGPAPRSPVQAAPQAAPDAWKSKLVWETTRAGTPRPAKHAENAVIVVRYHPDWIGKVRFDTFAQSVTVQDPPWHESNRTDDATTVRPWTDTDSQRLSSWLRRELGVDFSIDSCDRAVAVVAEASKYHPVKDWLSTLRWDGTLRLPNAARTYLGASSQELDKYSLRWWMIAAVARIYKPGCKADNVLILEGDQGLKKSSWLRALTGEQWFSDTSFDISNKDAFLALQGHWVLELAELDQWKGVEASKLKAFFSSPTDAFRPPYGRRVIHVPRSCVFAGSTNDATYLRDSTGNRRYWPVACTQIDVDAVARDREQLWAEARELYLSGVAWWPITADELAAARAAADRRAETDAWEPLIARYLATHLSLEPTVGEVLSDAIGVERERWDRPAQMRVSTILQRLGYRRKQVREGAGRAWRYALPLVPMAPVVTNVTNLSPTPVGDSLTH